MGACRQDGVTPQGRVEVIYRSTTSDEDPPQRIELGLYNRSYTPFNCSAFQSGYGRNDNVNVSLNSGSPTRNVTNPNGSERFTDLDIGLWFVVATGYGENQIPISQGCQEFTVEENQVRQVDVTLSDRPVDLGKLYRTSFDIGGTIPGLVQVLLKSLPFFCAAATNIDPVVCNLINSFASLIGEIDVDATWQIEQYGTTASISLLIDRLNGRVMDSQCRRMARGSISGYVSGTEIRDTDEDDLTIDSDDFVDCLYRAGLLRIDNRTDLGALVSTALTLISGGVNLTVDDLKITSAPGGTAETLRGDVTIKLDLSPFGSYETTEDIVADRKY